MSDTDPAREAFETYRKERGGWSELMGCGHEYIDFFLAGWRAHDGWLDLMEHGKPFEKQP